MGRGVSATSVAALALAALLGGCGGGHESKPSTSKSSTSNAGGRSSASTPGTSSTTTTSNPAAPSAASYWTYAKLVKSLAGRTLVLPRGSVHLDSALMECNGEGTPLRTGATRRWQRYTCTQTMFRNGLDRDVTFDVTILSATQLSLTSPRYGPN